MLLALAASALLTAAVSLPMAYQAREARNRDQNEPPRTPAAEVLGSSTVRPSVADSGALVWWTDDGDAQPLNEATVPTVVRIALELPDTVRADFRLDNGPVVTDAAAPFELDDGRPVELAPGPRSVTVTATDASGTTTLHQAFFTVAD